MGDLTDRLVGSRPLVAIVGPTATGKTALALQLAAACGGEIVGCDALQIRAGLPLLTAKPSAAELQRVPHHLVGVLPLDEPATAAQYAALADAVIAQLGQRRRPAVVCGGTGLYLRALCEGLFAGPGKDAALRARLREEARSDGVAALHRRLATIDAEAAARIAPADYVRIERALEVFLLSGRPISAWQADSRRERGRGPRYRVLRVGVDPGPEALRARIARRLQDLLAAGLLAEVAAAHAAHAALHYPPLGYDLCCRHLRGELPLAEMATQFIHKTAQYARRQRTWFRREPAMHWYPDADAVPVDELATFLKER